MSNRKLITFDWAMKRLLRSKANFEILEGFLSELLSDDIIILEILESESNKETQTDKYNRVDLKVKTGTSEIVIIEIQYDRQFDYLQRILYGTSKVITEHQKESEPYSSLLKVISVNILYFDLGHGSDYIYRGTTSFSGIHDNDRLELSPTQQRLYGKDQVYHLFPEYYLIRVNNFNDIATTPLDQWIYFLKNEEIKDDFKAKGLQKAKKAFSILSLAEKDRLAFARYQDDLRYQASLVESNYGLGRLDGEKQGIEKGIKQGIEKGVLKERIENARKMKQLGVDVKLIMQVTGLTLSEIESL